MAVAQEAVPTHTDDVQDDDLPPKRSDVQLTMEHYLEASKDFVRDLIAEII